MRDDLAYLSRRHLDGAMAADLRISKHTRQHHLSLILELFGYRMIDQPTRLTLEERALAAARISNRPVYALRPSDRPAAAPDSDFANTRFGIV